MDSLSLVTFFFLILSKKDAKMMTKISKVVNRINSKKQTPPTPNKNKKFSSVSEMAASGSPLARDLFGSGLTPEGEEKSMQFVQRTGKVICFLLLFLDQGRVVLVWNKFHKKRQF